MNIRKIFLAMLAALALSLSVSPTSLDTADTGAKETVSGKCRVPTLAEARAEAKAIFTGKVTAVTQGERGKTFEFQVTKYWKGINGRKVSVKAYDSMRYQSFFKVDETYLIFAWADEEGELRDRRCSRSQAIGQATEDLKALGKGKRPR
jgi:hypothetical protein